MGSFHIGEAVIDFSSVGDLSFQGRCGGSPLNTAIAVARLGQPAGYITQLSTDLFGQRLRQHIDANGLDTRFLLTHPAPTTLAFVEYGTTGNRYQFLANGSADSLYAPEPLPQLPGDTSMLQFGSVSLVLEPSASSIVRLVRAHRARLVVVLDPNVRPTLIPDMDRYRRQFLDWLPLCHILKLSDEDAALLCEGDPGRHFKRWLTMGPQVILLTRGRAGARIYLRPDRILEVAAAVVPIADTVGAGDTFTAGMMAALMERGIKQAAQLAGLDDADWQHIGRFACMAAALCCTRPGAASPTRAEVTNALLAL